jgi:hypothetical protein
MAAWPHDPCELGAVIGVWATASRRKSRIWDDKRGGYVNHGRWEQVSRLANLLFNEVLVPMTEKDRWNRVPLSADHVSAKYLNRPELQGLLPVLYPRSPRRPRSRLSVLLRRECFRGVRVVPKVQ